MDLNAIQQNPPIGQSTCPVCHQPVSPGQYFCSNCGAKVHEAPLSTTPLMQLGLYAFSIILPIICFLLITKWPGVTYVRSKDEKTRTVGMIACTLLLLSTIVTFYLAYVWTQDALQQSLNEVNAEMNY